MYSPNLIILTLVQMHNAHVHVPFTRRTAFVMLCTLLFKCPFTDKSTNTINYRAAATFGNALLAANERVTGEVRPEL